MKCVAWNARLLVVGFAAGEIERVAMNRVLLKNISILGLHWGLYAQKEPDTVGEVWAGIFDLMAKGRLRSITFTDQTYDGLDSVPRALTALAGRETWGKVVVRIAEHEGQGEGEDEDRRASRRRSTKL